jgi:hypothetical protein
MTALLVVLIMSLSAVPAQLSPAAEIIVFERRTMAKLPSWIPPPWLALDAAISVTFFSVISLEEVEAYTPSAAAVLSWIVLLPTNARIGWP